jgi:hypothetical protein
MKRLNLLFFKIWIVLAALFGTSTAISIFVAPPVITKYLGICFLWTLFGVIVGVFFSRQLRQDE